ncbi:MAG: hypothetical protein ACRD96_09155 [Bryobacteraceae bacterium]
MRVLVPLVAVLSLMAQVRQGQSVEQLVQKGAGLTPGAASQLEQQLEKSPFDIAARAQLIGYYYYQWMEVGEARAIPARRRLILWTIRNQPDSPLISLWEATLEPRGHQLADREGFDEARRIFLAHIESKPAPAVLGNAGNFFKLFDKELAERAYRRALALDPANGEWQWRLGYLYGLGVLGIDGLAFNGQPTSVDAVARDGPFAAKARKELHESASPMTMAVAANVISRYGTMLGATDRARVEHLNEAEKLIRRAAELEPANPSWKQMLQQTIAWRAQMLGPALDGAGAERRRP